MCCFFFSVEKIPEYHGGNSANTKVFLYVKGCFRKKSGQFAEDGFPAVFEHFTLKRHPS